MPAGVPAGVPDASFEGFGEDLPLFYEGLAADNSRAYFADHRPVYEEQVRGPLTALLADLSGEFGPGKVFRPNRDVRFSHDKSPYKLSAAGHAHGADDSASLYLHVDAEGLLVAGGYYAMSRDQLARYRAAVADDGTGRALRRVVDGLLRSGGGWELAGPALVRAPRGFDPGHPRIDLLRRKGLVLAQHHDVEPWLFTPQAAEVVAQGWRDLAPLNRWLARHVGPPVPDANDRDTSPRR